MSKTFIGILIKFNSRLMCIDYSIFRFNLYISLKLSKSEVCCLCKECWQSEKCVNLTFWLDRNADIYACEDIVRLSQNTYNYSLRNLPSKPMVIE